MISLAVDSYLDILKGVYTTYLPADVEVKSRVLKPVGFTSEAPNEERLKRDVTRFRDAGTFSSDWCMIQWNRGPLQIDPEDDFRTLIDRSTSELAGTHTVKEFGFSICDLEFFLFANNGTTIEACEDLFYLSLYKIKTVGFSYESIDFNARVVHESLGAFASHSLKDVGTLFRIDWTVRFFVPILVDTSSGLIILAASTKVYGHDADDTEFEEDGISLADSIMYDVTLVKIVNNVVLDIEE